MPGTGGICSVTEMESNPGHPALSVTVSEIFPSPAEMHVVVSPVDHWYVANPAEAQTTVSLPAHTIRFEEGCMLGAGGVVSIIVTSSVPGQPSLSVTVTIK